MNFEKVKAKVDEYVATADPDEVIERFKSYGYKFIDIELGYPLTNYLISDSTYFNTKDSEYNVICSGSYPITEPLENEEIVSVSCGEDEYNYAA